MDLTGKAALLTGGKRIGLVAAAELASRGVDIAFSYARSKAEAEEGVEQVRALGRRAFAIEADLSTPHACRALVSDAAARLGRLDVLINMASVYRGTPFELLTDADWRAPLDVDLGASFFCSRAAAPLMRAQGGGRIINFSDWIARSGRPRYRDFLPYYVAKAAVIALTESLALELAADNILVNAIAPGPIVPPPATTDREMKAIEDATPLGRWGGAPEIARAIVGLLDSDFITGETIRVDGGRHLR
jgi:NAD(P)-dependent dehydrogenase (short-subunit alcohol dehydrogenase family)